MWTLLPPLSSSGAGELPASPSLTSSAHLGVRPSELSRGEVQKRGAQTGLGVGALQKLL